MKLKVVLSKFNDTGSIAHIANDDDYTMDVAVGVATKPKAACMAAAKALREAAARFELLAQEAEPYQCKTHTRINRAKLTANAELCGGPSGPSERAPG